MLIAIRFPVPRRRFSRAKTRFSAVDSGIGRAPARPRPVARDPGNAPLQALVAALATEGAPANPAAGDPPCWRLPVRGVEAGEDLGAGTQLGFAEPVERRRDGVEELMHVAGIGLDKEEPCDDLAQRVTLLQIG
jgi:hypothetical protein